MRVGIIGNGYVGQATALLKCKDVDIIIYDKDPDKCIPAGTTLSTLTTCDFVFVCVPTPMRLSGECDVSIVETVVQDLVDLCYDKSRIVVRSTVPVGTCKRLGVMFFPEFLTERNWRDDFRNNKIWVLGWDSENVSRSVVARLYDGVFRSAFTANKLKQIPQVDYYTTEEAELAKYVRNTFLAVKVSVFNEIHSFCEHKGIDYDKLRDAVGADKRIGHSHTQVPGPDGKSGFGGTCFPKDISSLIYQFESAGIDPTILKSVKSRNETIDRPDKDWELAKGRAVTEL